MLRTALVTMMVGLAGAGAANAQDADLTKTLTALEQVWVEALVAGDIAKLDAILVDSYSDTEEGGHISDKAGSIAVLKTGDLKFKSIKLSNMKVFNHGAAAVVVGAADQDGTFKGHPLDTKIVFTDTFVLSNGTWKAAASARTVAPK